MSSQKQVFDMSHADLISLQDAVIPFFNEKHEKAARNEKRFLGRNWRDDQEVQIKSQGRHPFSMPLTMSKANTIRQTMRETRMGFKIDATVDPNDEIKAELATIQLKDYMKRNKFRDLEAEIFDYGFAINIGVSKLYLDYQGYYPVIKSKKVDHYNFIWDINSIEYDLSDALWVCETEKVYRYQIKEMFPNSEQFHEGQEVNFNGRRWQEYYISRNEHGNSDFDIITLFHHFQKVEREYHCVIVDDPELFKDPLVGEFRTRKEAEETKKLVEMQQAMALRKKPTAEIVKKNKIEYDYYAYDYSQILDYHKTDHETTPYNVFFSIRMGNDYTTFTDFMESPQIFMDRLFSQIDYSLGTDLKKIYEVDENRLSARNTPEQAISIMKKGGVLFRKGEGQLVNITEGTGANPQFFQIIDVLKQFVEDMAGGRSFQGLDEGSESGVAIRQKQMQGQLVAGLFIDNFLRWKFNHGDNVIRWIRKFETMERTMKVAGGEITPEMIQLLQQHEIFAPSMKNDGSGYVKIFKHGDNLTYLDNFEYELALVETELSDSERAMRYYQMLEMEKNNPMMMQSPTWNQLKISYMPGITEGDKQKILQEFAQMAQQQQRMAQEEQNMKKAEILSRMPIMPQKQEEKKEVKK